MKKLSIFIVFAFIFSACNKESLNISNPNAPTSFSLTSETAINAFALGLINKQLGEVTNAGTTNLFVIAMVQQSLMGDELFSPYGNYCFRWTDQVYSVTPPTAAAPVVNPFGVTQLSSLQGFNSRQAGDRNAFLYEWNFAYNYIAQCNLLLAALDNPELSISGDATTKKGLLKAWAYWWKGYAYSRVGSIYLGGLVVNTAGNTTNNYVSHDQIIDEANSNYDKALNELQNLVANDAYINTYKAITPSYNDPNNVIEPNMWIHVINTMKARNLIANKKFDQMTSIDWNTVLTLTQNGVGASDNVFMQGMTPDGANDVSGGFFHPYALVGTFQEFTFVSERLIQEYHDNDNRLALNFTQDGSYPPNIRSRGLQFGTRWTVNNIEDGGSFATNNNNGSLAIAGSFEENELMTAEALINTGQIEQGLQIVDQIRTLQGAGVPAVAGIGLNLDQANEELRRERRVALFLRGTAFYDARRWGITKPVSEGGGRANAMVYLPVSDMEPGATAPDVRPCLMDYQYVDYFDVPLNELDFNQPSAISAPVKN
jgi:hypothetical protein